MKGLKWIAIILWAVVSWELIAGQIELQYKSNEYALMYDDNGPSNRFVQSQNIWTCRGSALFTYNQTQQQYNQNMGYNVRIQNFTSQLTISISSKYKLFEPSINQTVCGAGENCTIEIFNNCPVVSYFLYFDIVQIFIPQLPGLSVTTPLSYNVICDNSQPRNSFTWGEIILIFTATVVITFTSLCSKAWSWKNAGFEIKYISILVLSIILIIGLSFIATSNTQLIQIIKYTVVFMSFTFGTFSVMFCTSEILYLIPSFGLHKGIYLKVFQIRVMDVIGLVIGMGLTCAWWLTEKNFLLSNIIDICMLITLIKLVKFTSLKIPILFYICTTGIMVVFIIIITLINDTSYEHTFQMTLTSPFLLELPTITPVPNQKCSSLYMFSLAFPGILLSYIVRFDNSRSSKVYTITFVLCFIACSLIWSIISVVSPFLIPFDIITLPVAMGLIAFFSNRRNQFPVLWYGLFQDEQYKHNRMHITELMEVVKNEKSPSELTFRQSLLRGLKMRNGSYFTGMSSLSIFSKSSSGQITKNINSSNQS